MLMLFPSLELSVWPAVRATCSGCGDRSRWGSGRHRLAEDPAQLIAGELRGLAVQEAGDDAVRVGLEQRRTLRDADRHGVRAAVGERATRGASPRRALRWSSLAQPGVARIGARDRPNQQLGIRMPRRL